MPPPRLARGAAVDHCRHIGSKLSTMSENPPTTPDPPAETEPAGDQLPAHGTTTPTEPAAPEPEPEVKQAEA